MGSHADASDRSSPIDVACGALGDGTAAAPRLVVETWLAVPAGDDWRVLLLRRKPDQGGFWQGVSGGVEAYDASLRAAAVREIREETGLVDADVFDLGLWIPFRGFRSGLHYVKRSLGAILPATVVPAGLTLSDEHDEAALFTFEDAMPRLLFRENHDELGALREALARR